MTTLPTAAGIADLIAFVRKESDQREEAYMPGLVDEYVTSARRALAIAERLPALVAEIERHVSDRKEMRAAYEQCCASVGVSSIMEMLGMIARLTKERDDARAIIDGQAKDGEVCVVVSGFTGSGKSAIAGEIEIALRAIGVSVEWPGGKSEKNTTHADWQTALELYNPRVVIIERNIPREAK